MKKSDLLKSIGLCFIIFIVLSWIIPIGSYSSGEFVKATTAPLGLTDLFYYPVITFGTFMQYGIVFLCIGGFYGVMSKTGVYQKLVNSIVKKWKGKEKKYLILNIVILTVLASVIGTPLGFFIFLPFLMNVLSEMGYNKMTVFAATIGATLLGNVGATFGVNTVGHVNKLLGLSIMNNMVIKVALLAVIIFLLIVFILKTAKIDKKEEKEEIFELEEEKDNKKSHLPLMIILIVSSIVLLVGMFNWKYVFEMTFFDEVYENLIGITIGNFPIVKNILGSLAPMGYWDSYEMCVVLLIASLLIGWIYSIKFQDLVKGFAEGAKKYLKVAFFVTLASIIFTLMLANSNGSMLMTITNFFVGLSENFNLFASAALTAIGSFFYNNFYYLSSAIVSPMAATYTDTTVYAVMGYIVQTIHSFMMLILPTSLILIAGLSMLNISIKEWLKYIWKFLIQLLIIIIIVGIILIILL